MFLSRIGSILDRCDVCLDSSKLRVAAVHEVLDESRRAALRNAESVVEHEYLAVDLGARANSDDRGLD